MKHEPTSVGNRVVKFRLYFPFPRSEIHEFCSIEHYFFGIWTATVTVEKQCCLFSTCKSNGKKLSDLKCWRCIGKQVDKLIAISLA